MKEERAGGTKVMKGWGEKNSEELYVSANYPSCFTTTLYYRRAFKEGEMIN